MKNGEISKILLVDDNSEQLTLLKAILRNVETSIFMASSGEEALNLVRENNFALMVLDIRMPKMNGYELADRIMNLCDGNLAPIIFLTAIYLDEIPIFSGYGNGAIDFMTKPLDITIFKSKVKEYLELDQQIRNANSSVINIANNLQKAI